ncbi:MAG TPA: response regulator [Acetobacteraceae bacterium]|nr:response regulator [Acetobacteraceae bacterium]
MRFGVDALARNDERGGAAATPSEVVKGCAMAMGRLVSVVDDDISVRESLPDLLRSFGFEVAPFESAEAFLDSESLSRTRCLILDISMPGMTGPELQEELIRRGDDIPIVFITAHSDDRVIPRLLERGAVVCLYKPLNETALIDAVGAALELGAGG